MGDDVSTQRYGLEGGGAAGRTRRAVWQVKERGEE